MEVKKNLYNLISLNIRFLIVFHHKKYCSVCTDAFVKYSLAVAARLVRSKHQATPVGLRCYCYMK